MLGLALVAVLVAVGWRRTLPLWGLVLLLAGRGLLAWLLLLALLLPVSRRRVVASLLAAVGERGVLRAAGLLLLLVAWTARWGSRLGAWAAWDVVRLRPRPLCWWLARRAWALALSWAGRGGSRAGQGQPGALAACCSWCCCWCGLGCGGCWLGRRGCGGLGGGGLGGGRLGG